MKWYAFQMDAGIVYVAPTKRTIVNCCSLGSSAKKTWKRYVYGKFLLGNRRLSTNKLYF